MPLRARFKPIPPEAPKPTVHNFLDLTGQAFGRLVANYYAGRIDEKPSWVCLCSCGRRIVAVTKQLVRGQTQSCGCLQIERSSEANRKHGGKGTRLYRIWSGMWNRCRNSNDHSFKNYGGRGIIVCDAWKSFETFKMDMGEPPSDRHSIERMDNGKGYGPENCVWIPLSDQSLNRRSSLRITFNGVTMVASQWEKALGLKPGMVSRRLRKGWPIPMVLNQGGLAHARS